MRNTRDYDGVFFSVQTIAAAIDKLERIFVPSEKNENKRWTLSTKNGTSQWQYDSSEEFFSDYRKIPDEASLSFAIGFKHDIDLHWAFNETTIAVQASDRTGIEAVFRIFEDAVPSSTLPEEPAEPEPPPPRPTIFIGHGHSPSWRDLKDHLHEKHDYDVQAYETGARAGHTIRDILQDLVKSTSFAILVLTAEDEHADGSMHARENVIHETGLFQGRLRYGRVIVLLENGAKEFSNIAGIQQIRFDKGRIAETYGEVLATLRREFGSK